MKLCLCVLAPLVFVLTISSRSFACTPEAAGCITSFTVAPSEIKGDNSDHAIATVTATIKAGTTGHILEIVNPTDPYVNFICVGSSHLDPNRTGTGYAGGCAHRHAT